MDNLITKYFQNACSDAEKQVLFDWIDASTDNKIYYRQLRQVWDANLISGSPIDAVQTGSAYLRLKDKLAASGWGKPPGGFRHYVNQALKIAAVVVISFASAWLYFKYREQAREVAWQTIEVPVGQRVLISLADGSKIWLNSMTHFSYPESFSKNKRVVKLDGEAYFEVARNVNLPFEVKTQHMDVQVKGTKFNVYAYSSRPNTETTLVDGKVLLSFTSNRSSEFELTPRQKAIYNPGTVAPEVISQVNTDIETSWTKGIYNFSDITFDKLIERLEHYFDVKIVVKRNDILTYHCTGKFLYDETIEDILDVVKTSKPFTYKIENRVITIY